MALGDKDPDQALSPFPGHGEQVTEYMAFDTSGDEAIQVITAEDTGESQLGAPDEQDPGPVEFYANLADGIIPEIIQDRITAALKLKVEEDKKAREERDKQYEEGVRRTGMGKDAPGGAEFEGATKVVHPMLTEACIDYESRVIKELFPPTGPVKPNVLGEPTQDKVDRADRKTRYMNYQFTQQIVEAFGVLETTLTQVPLGGAQYIRLTQDHRLKRPRMDFVPIDRCYVPFAATSWHASSRRTYSEPLTRVEFQQRIDSGQYREIELGSSATFPEQSKTEVATDKIEGKTESSTNIDGVREVWETMEYLEVSDDMAEVLGFEEAGQLYPYLVSVDVESGKMLAMYRDWEKEDPTKEPIEHLFEFPFIPWRGAYAVGFPHIIGGLSAAATGALRGLLDSAHIQNSATAAILKGSGVSGQNRRLNPGELMEIDGGVEADDIRKRIMPFPHNGPSPVLFQLLEFVVEAAKGTVRTSLDETATVNGNSPVPVGTQLSRVEEGMVVFSAIHNRAHKALNRLIIGLHRLNRLYLPEEVTVEAGGTEIVVYRKDFYGSPDVMPTSDPTIYSDQQRMNQIGAIQARSAQAPNLYKAREVELAFLRLLRWPEPEKILVDQPEPHELSAPNENLAMALGAPVKAFPDQSHLAHLQVLLDFAKSPALGSNPLISQAYLPRALTHAKEHIVMFYVETLVKTLTQTTKLTADELHSEDTAVKAKLDELFATASPGIVAQVEQTLQGTLPVLQHMMQMVQALSPKPPVDPAAAAVQAAAAETQRKTADDQQTNALKAQQIQVDQQGQELQASTKMQVAQLDTASAQQIAQERLEGGQGVGGLSDGASLSEG